MNPVQPEELSAFLDGELSIERMHEIQHQLNSDTALRAHLEALQGLDRKWHAAAFEARFEPSIRMPHAEPASRVVLIAALGTGLAGLRLVSKVVDAELLVWALVNASVLAVLLAATVWLIDKEKYVSSAR